MNYFKRKRNGSLVFSFQLGNAPDITCMCMIAFYNFFFVSFYFMPRLFQALDCEHQNIKNGASSMMILYVMPLFVFIVL